jgi:cell division protein FtsW
MSMASRARSSTARGRGRSDRRARAGGRLGHATILIATTALALVVVGLIMILSASSVTSFANYGSSFWFFQRQVLWAIVGVGAFAGLARLDYRRLRGLGYPLLGIAVVLLAAVLVPGLGITAGGSARWLGLGALSFQPSEVAKLALVVFVADVLARKRERCLRNLAHTLIPLLPILGLLATLVMLQPDLGTTLLLASIGMGMLFAGGAPLIYLVPLSAAGAVAGLAAALSADYRRERILAYLDPWSDPLNTGYQTIQSLIALGSGGWLGLGLGASRQKWSYVPNAHTDFIFAILGEEMGLLGTLTVVGLFAFLTWLGIWTARHAPDRFGMLLASGITVWVASQALVNMGAVTAALPITGVPLPLVSFGGTSLVMSLGAMGVLSNVASQARRPRARGPAA